MDKRFHARCITLGMLAAAVMLLASAPAALASHFQSGGGSVQLGPPTTLWEKTFGSTTINDQEGSLGFAGTLAGNGTINVLTIIGPTGPEHNIGLWSAPAIVHRQSGTVTVRLLGTDDGTTFSGTLFATGSHGLRGFFGEGQFSGMDMTGSGSYTLNYVAPWTEDRWAFS
jgi:hypothetical protein